MPFLIPGTLAYIPTTESTGEAARRTLVWVDRNGKEEPLAAQPNAYAGFAISPDGTKLAIEIGLNPDIWIGIWLERL